MHVQMVNLFWAPHIDTLNALMRLQSYGVTEKEILNVYEFVNRARLENAVRMSRGHIDSPLLYFGKE